MRFVNWLESQNGIYWISGKAGSGKSTLMKYLCDHKHTIEALRTWAEQEELITASYFFWNSGTSMQESQQGLLQSLLYKILKQSPKLLATVCRIKYQNDDSHYLDLEPWSSAELLAVLGELAKQDLVVAKHCFFIDGLDEYDSDHSDIIRILTDLATSSNIKICLSSRPWNVFVDAFGEDRNRMLSIQELTSSDIQLYVNSKLKEDARFVQLAKIDARCEDLTREIVEKAKGVWLWVYLIVRSLLNGLTQADDISDLQTRLHLLPADLETYFLQILNSIEQVYQQQTAHLLRVMVQAIAPLSVVAIYFIDKDFSCGETNVYNEADNVALYHKVRKRLNARCKDLLEVTIDPQENSSFTYNVDFLHRTVKDFLQTKDIHNLLVSRSAPYFDARISLCRTLLAQIKSLPVFDKSASNRRSHERLRDVVSEFCWYAHEIEIYNGESEIALIDELDRTMSIRAGKADAHWSNSIELPRPTGINEYGQKNMLALMVEYGLSLYVSQKLDHQSSKLQEKRGRPLLDYALRGDTFIREDQSGLEIVRLLLNRGANPNQIVHISNGISVWGLFLQSFYKEKTLSNGNLPESSKKWFFRVTDLLIEHGADQDLSIETDHHSGSTARYKRTIERPQYMRVLQILQSILLEEEALKLQEKMIMRRKYGIWSWLGWT